MKRITFKKYKFVILSIFFILFVILGGFYQYYHDYFSYYKEYYVVKETRCQNTDLKICEFLKTEETIDHYLKNNDPVKKYEKLDAITLTAEIVENSIFRNFQFFSPLLIAIMVIGTLHTEWSSGMFKNYLTRMNYKDYVKKNIKIVAKIALIMPLSLLVIFILSMCITRFHFEVHESTKILAVYFAPKYQHFFLYSIVIGTAQYLLSFTYGLMALICCKKNKNKLVSVIMSYIVFLITDLVLLIVIYSLFINKVLHIKNVTDYFSITGYWFFNTKINYGLVLLLPILLGLFFYFIVHKVYLSKEEVIQENEKQVA